MFRSALITAYIIAVLLASGFARADQGLIQKVQYKPEIYFLHIHGTFATACESQPRPKILSQKNDLVHETLVLGVETVSNNKGSCAKIKGGQFDLVFDIRSLTLPIQKPLKIRFVQSHIPELNVIISDPSEAVSFSEDFYVGTLFEAGLLGFARTPVYALIDDQQRVVYIKSVLNLSDYINRRVQVSGLPLDYELNPVTDEISLDYAKQTAGALIPMIFATEISSVPLQ